MPPCSAAHSLTLHECTKFYVFHPVLHQYNIILTQKILGLRKIQKIRKHLHTIENSLTTAMSSNELRVLKKTADLKFNRKIGAFAKK